VTASSAIDADAFARLICDWCLEVREGQQVMVACPTVALDPVVALHRAILERGAWPVLRLTPPGLGADFYRFAREGQIDSFAPLELVEMESIDAFARIQAPSNTRELAGIDPALVARAGRARAAVQAVRMRRRWCATIWPTAALAQEAGMSERDYTSFVRGALFLDREDPVAGWRALSARQASLVERLAAARSVRIESEETDLRVDVSGRTWINSDGRRNMPSGEVFTGPHETSANGTVLFDVPSSRGGSVVERVRLVFADGEVVSASAERGSGQLEAALATDAGARFLGELGIGTNTGIDRATGSTLLDEKIAGTVHMALGRSYPETGGVNASALHWDLICDLRGGGRVSLDGEPLIVDGSFV
jgi:aminopeptidase